MVKNAVLPKRLLEMSQIITMALVWVIVTELLNAVYLSFVYGVTCTVVCSG